MGKVIIGCGGLFAAILVITLIVSVAVGGRFAGGMVDAFFNRTVGVTVDNSKTDRVRQSNQYISSIETRLAELATEYGHTTDPGQKAAIRNEIRLLADRIPADRVPSSAMVILSGGK